MMLLGAFIRVALLAYLSAALTQVAAEVAWVREGACAPIAEVP